jgi:CRP-like cAMP-binding protein
MKKILLIETDEQNKTQTEEILKLANYQVHCANNGRSGLEIANKEHPEIILSPINMPGLDGFGLLRLLQKQEWFSQSAFFFLSDNFCKDHLRNAMDNGADDILFKPYDGLDLLTAIESRINKIQHLTASNHLDQKTKIELLSERELLESFTNNRNIVRLNKRQTLLKEGERPTKLYFVLEGKLRAFRTHPDGKELAIELFGPGDFIGFAEIIKESNYLDTIETIDSAKIAIIPKTEFETLIHEHQIIYERFTKIMITRALEIEKRLVWVAYNSLRQKVAAALLYLKAKYGDQSLGPFCINLNRSVFASIAGTAKESSIRILSEFKSERLIDIDEDGTIKVITEKPLKDIIE